MIIELQHTSMHIMLYVCTAAVYRIAQNSVEKSDKIDESSMSAGKFDEQNFDELIVAFIGKVLTGKRLEGKTLTNRSPFIKFIRLFHRQSMGL